MDEYTVEIAQALLELPSLSPEAFQGLAARQRWSISEGPPRLWEAGATYPVVLDHAVERPIIVCPLIGTDEVGRREARAFLRGEYAKAVTFMSAVLGPPAESFEWSAERWAASIWSGKHGVVVSLEETGYEGEELPFLILACDLKDAEAVALRDGWTARCFPSRRSN
jgi:hypothetical protein